MRSATAWGCSIWTGRAGCGARPFTAEWPWALRPFSFRERDYLPEYTGQGIALADAVRQRVSEALGRPVTGAVRLLTQPRSWGLCFNPVSFFYCFDEQEQLAAVLCEVSNTPGVSVITTYCRPTATAICAAAWPRPSTSRRSCRSTEYRMRFNPPGRRIGVHMEDWQGELKLFDATLGTERQPLGRGAVHRYLFGFPG